MQATRIIRRLSCLILVCLWWLPAAGQDVHITVDATKPGEPLKHVWSFFGYDEPNYTYLPDSVDLIDTISNAEPDPVHLRMHFLLTSGDGSASRKWGSTNAYTEDAQGNPVYSWAIMDRIMDTITGHGALPLVEIGFMPQALTSHEGPYRNSTYRALDGGTFYPPRDYDNWAGLIREWAKHSKARYLDAEKKWLWELWNEPNIAYWKGTPEEYQKLFDYTEKSLHEVMPQALLGAPHSAGPGPWLAAFLKHTSEGTNYVTGQRGTRLDYVGFHAKGGVQWVENNGGFVRMNLKRQLDLHAAGFQNVADVPMYRNTPIIIGEADPDGCAACPAAEFPANNYRNGTAYAAYEVAMMKYSMDIARDTGVNLKGVLTWAWMFGDQPWFYGYRTLSTHGIHKPVLNAYVMLGKLVGREIPLTSDGALGAEAIRKDGARGDRPDVNGMAVTNENLVRAVVWNYHDELRDAGPARVMMTLKLPTGMTGPVKLTHWRIDETHSNAFTVWKNLGSPQNPNAAQIAMMKRAMQLQMLEEPQTITPANGNVQVEFELPRFGLSLVEVRKVQ